MAVAHRLVRLGLGVSSPVSWASDPKPPKSDGDQFAEGIEQDRPVAKEAEDQGHGSHHHEQPAQPRRGLKRHRWQLRRRIRRVARVLVFLRRFVVVLFGAVSVASLSVFVGHCPWRGRPCCRRGRPGPFDLRTDLVWASPSCRPLRRLRRFAARAPALGIAGAALAAAFSLARRFPVWRWDRSSGPPAPSPFTPPSLSTATRDAGGRTIRLSRTTHDAPARAGQRQGRRQHRQAHDHDGARRQPGGRHGAPAS